MAHESQQCEFILAKDLKCPRSAEYKVMTQMPPYTNAYCCCNHLFLVIDRLLGRQQCPVLVRRYLGWTWS